MIVQYLAWWAIRQRLQASGQPPWFRRRVRDVVPMRYRSARVWDHVLIGVGLIVACQGGWRVHPDLILLEILVPLLAFWPFYKVVRVLADDIEAAWSLWEERHTIFDAAVAEVQAGMTGHDRLTYAAWMRDIG